MTSCQSVGYSLCSGDHPHCCYTHTYLAEDHPLVSKTGTAFWYLS